jgi:hypothetical protein
VIKVSARYRWEVISDIFSRRENLRDALTREGIDFVEETGLVKNQNLDGVGPETDKALSEIGFWNPEDILDEYDREHYQQLMDIKLPNISNVSDSGIEKKRQILGNAVISALGSTYTKEEVDTKLREYDPTTRSARKAYPWQEQREDEVVGMLELFGFGDGRLRKIRIQSDASGLTQEEMESISDEIPPAFVSPVSRNVYYGLSVVDWDQQKEFYKNTLKTWIYKKMEGDTIENILKKGLSQDLGVNETILRSIVGEMPNVQVVDSRVVADDIIRAERQLFPDFTILGMTSNPNIFQETFIPANPDESLEDHRAELVVDNFVIRPEKRNAVFRGLFPIRTEEDLRSVVGQLGTSLKFGFIPRGISYKEGVKVSGQLGKYLISTYPDFKVSNTFFKADAIRDDGDYFVIDVMENPEFEKGVDRFGFFSHKEFLDPEFEEIGRGGMSDVDWYTANHNFLGIGCIQSAEGNYNPYKHLKKYLRELRKGVNKRPTNRQLEIGKARRAEGARAGEGTYDKLLEEYDDSVDDITGLTGEALEVAKLVWENDLERFGHYYKRGGCSIAEEDSEVEVEGEKSVSFKIHKESPLGLRMARIFRRCRELETTEAEVNRCVADNVILQQNVSGWISDEMYSMNRKEISDELRENMEEYFDSILAGERVTIKDPTRVKNEIIDSLITEGKKVLTLDRMEFLDRLPSIVREHEIIER